MQPMNISSRRLATYCMLLLVLTILNPCLSKETESLNAYIAPPHKTVFDQFNAMVFGDVSLAKVAFRGAIAVQGKAEITDFEIAGEKTCDKDKKMVVVAQSLSARMGSVNGGYCVVGRGSSIHHTVRMPCSNRVEQFDPIHNGDIEFEELRRSMLSEAGKMCVHRATATTKVENDTMKFEAGDNGYSCYTFFKVTTDELRLINRWVNDGKDYYRNIVIVISGLRTEFRDFRMDGFNPRRTLIVFCAVYGTFGFYNAKIFGSMIAPTAHFITMGLILNGSIIAGNMRGSLASLNAPYVIC